MATSADTGRRPHIVQFGLPYSPNLGDGVISECMVHGIGRLLPGARVTTLDLSTRQGFEESVVSHRRIALKVLSALPRKARQTLVERRLGPILDAAWPSWAKAVASADLVLIGGGQLFSDADLNFPLKVAQAARVCSATRVPVAVCAAGVAGNWTKRGAALYAQLFQTRLAVVGLRDAPSLDAWTAQTDGRGPAPVLIRDPGLLARERYGQVRPDDRIGLCVSDPTVLRYHAAPGVHETPRDGAIEHLAKALVARGHTLRLFCNGAEEDARALAQAASRLSSEIAQKQVEVAPVPKRPEDLVRLVARCSGVVAHRLHACIVAYAYRRPVVGLGWDGKVESFFASTGQQSAFSPAGESPDTVAARLEVALDCPPRASAVDAATREALEGLRLALGPVFRKNAAPLYGSPPVKADPVAHHIP